MNLVWKAHYKDGTFLDQYTDGKPNGYENIDRKKLEAFEIIGDGKRIFCLFLEPGQRLIFRRRTAFDLVIKTQETRNLRYFLMVGWQHNINGINIQSINYIFDDGHVESAGRWAGGEPNLKSYELDDSQL